MEWTIIFDAMGRTLVVVVARAPHIGIRSKDDIATLVNVATAANLNLCVTRTLDGIGGIVRRFPRAPPRYPGRLLPESFLRLVLLVGLIGNKMQVMIGQHANIYLRPR